MCVCVCVCVCVCAFVFDGSLSLSFSQRILQPYVDDLFKGIFAVPRGKPLAKAIKFLYDFLDLQVSILSVNSSQ